MNKTKKTQVKVKSYTRKDGTRVRSSQRSIETNNIKNTYELQRRRKGKELLRDIGSGLTLGIINPSEITRKRTSVRKAQAAGIGATAYGGYRAIKALRNRKKNKK